MKLSEITGADVKKYLRLRDNDDDDIITPIMAAAFAKIIEYTALTEEEADGKEELYYAFMCLCSDMYNSRDFTVQNDKLNPTVKTILNMHRRNLVM